MDLVFEKHKAGKQTVWAMKKSKYERVLDLLDRMGPPPAKGERNSMLFIILCVMGPGALFGWFIWAALYLPVYK